MSEPTKRKPSPRLPWKRGPVAWTVACQADEILEALSHHHRNFLSLREVARRLNVSTQPVRDWTRRKYIKREGPRHQYCKAEVCRFVKWLAEKAQPFDTKNYLKRLPSVYPFAKLSQAAFVWPKGCPMLTPRELARLIPCHPSLILLAIRRRTIRARRRTACRWEISRRAWTDAFPSSVISKPKVPSIPNLPTFSTRTVANYLSEWGLLSTQSDVRQMIREGKLEAIRPTPGKRKIFVPRASLDKYRDNFCKSH